MKKLSVLFVIITVVISLNGCSIVPGVPGLTTSATRYVKPPKEGRDYKLVVINSQTIKSQKSFNYANYIASKRKRSKAFASINKLKATSYSSRGTGSSHLSASAKIKNWKAGGAIHAKTAFTGITSNSSKNNYQYRVGNKDIVNITVWDHPELTSPTDGGAIGHVVGNDGRFYFPYAGKVVATGKTTSDIRISLEQKLKKVITNPQITVRVSGFRSQKAYISGATLKPATLAISDIPMTVRDAISRSGGVTPKQFTGFASLARGNQKISIDLNRMLRHNDNSQNILLVNGDRLHILEKDELTEFRKGLNREVYKQNILNPIKLHFELQKERSLVRLKKELERELKSDQAKVFVMGEVHKPGTLKYDVEDGLTLAEAINDSGSFKEESVNPKGIFVIRKENDKDVIPTVYQLPLSAVHSMFLADQFKVRPRDIVYVTASPSIRWNRVLAQLIPSLTLVNTFHNLSK